jgi:hypothetical protein
MAKKPSPETTVRRCAADLRQAIEAARKAGYVVTVPFPVEALDRITHSQTAKVSG